MDRPPIPESVKRVVRVRCGFGCIFCGHPLIDYHHIVPYAEARCHEPGNLTALCANHHRDVTNGLIDRDAVVQADRAPTNRLSGVTRPYQVQFSGDCIEFELGGNRLRGGFPMEDGSIEFAALSVDDCDILSFRVDRAGCVLMQARFFDECNLPMLVIEENELVFMTHGWDAEFKGRRLVLRDAPRSVVLDVEFEPPSRIRIERGRLLCNGVEILVDRQGVTVVNCGVVIAGSQTSGGAIGLQFGRNKRGRSSCIGRDLVPRYGIDRKAMMSEVKRHRRAMEEVDAERRGESPHGLEAATDQ